MDPAAYIRRETGVSMAINALLSAGFFLAFFGTSGPVAVWGSSGYVADFGPQGFMIGLMSVLVPGLLARRARRDGRVTGQGGAARLPANIALRGVLCGLLGAAAGVIMAGATLGLIGSVEIGWLPAFMAKLGFGAALAWIVTPAGLRAELITRHKGAREIMS